jgi:GDPmannose 4,6-dehydratase
MGRALIVGHTGQDGTILWEQLAARGFTLTGVSRRETRHGADNTCEAPPDLHNLPALVELLRSCSPTQIYFLAAQHHSSQEVAPDPREEWRRSWQLHVHAFQNVLDAAAQTCPDASIFYASSSRVFGPAGTGLLNESTGLHPECAYGVTKAAGMLVARQYRRARGMRVNCGILFNHESPLRGPGFVSQRIVRGVVAKMRGAAGKLALGDLEAQVDWGFAPDYTRAMTMILEAEGTGDFVIASGRLHRIRDFLRVAAEHAGLEWPDVVEQDSQLLKRASQGLAGDSSRLRQTIGWEPSVEFEDMVRGMVDAEILRVSRTGP